jgi:4-hydroxy-4-methyl-2-oxoglutarate aldolase
MGFHYFAPGAVVSHGTATFLDVNVPVEIDGCWIRPGELLHGDANGLVVIPAEIADQVADQVDRVRESEGKMIEWLNSPDFDVAALRKRYGL